MTTNALLLLTLHLNLQPYTHHYIRASSSVLDLSTNRNYTNIVAAVYNGGPAVVTNWTWSCEATGAMRFFLVTTN